MPQSNTGAQSAVCTDRTAPGTVVTDPSARAPAHWPGTDTTTTPAPWTCSSHVQGYGAIAARAASSALVSDVMAKSPSRRSANAV